MAQQLANTDARLCLETRCELNTVEPRRDDCTPIRDLSLPGKVMEVDFLSLVQTLSVAHWVVLFAWRATLLRYRARDRDG